MPDDVLPALTAACAGLLFQSESDEPLEPFVWTELPPALNGAETVDVDEFFKNAVADQDWHGAAEKETARRFRELVRTLKGRLSGLRVFRAGAIQVDAYVVGRTASGGWAGVRTRLIET